MPVAQHIALVPTLQPGAQRRVILFDGYLFTAGTVEHVRERIGVLLTLPTKRARSHAPGLLHLGHLDQQFIGEHLAACLIQLLQWVFYHAGVLVLAAAFGCQSSIHPPHGHHPPRIRPVHNARIAPPVPVCPALSSTL
ncbi:hypothetical protein ACFLYO_00910 [Chloroflexota bacterium]